MSTKKIMQTRVKREQFMIMILVIGIAMGNGSVAWAGFFDACAADGDATITVTQDTTVKNERVTLQAEDTQQTCTIEVDDGVKLRLQNVNVSVTNGKRVNFIGGDTSSLIITNSKINACDSDMFGFQLVDISHSTFVDPPNGGCDVKELEPTGEIKIISSVLTTEPPGDSDVQITSQLGNVTVKNSTIISGDDVLIEAEAGDATVQANNIKANDNIEIIGSGAVKAITNAFQAAGVVTITGNPCRSQSNSPDIPCL
ncbi:hypothetical protein [Methylosarcina fibrata]|uniref:hypothetical protein n=1 Tax=Methylosarcina fibrata TaxID=105972 RepID=UPI0005246D89|nr:hypothetical protein [Methylosarcina fibrata]